MKNYEILHAGRFCALYIELRQEFSVNNPTKSGDQCRQFKAESLRAVTAYAFSGLGECGRNTFHRVLPLIDAITLNPTPSYVFHFRLQEHAETLIDRIADVFGK
jgi:hypothetical protein